MSGCWFPWDHVWSKWKRLADEALSAPHGVIGQLLTQERECQDCGMVQRRVVRTNLS